jgi:hypothetical protein
MRSFRQKQTPRTDSPDNLSLNHMEAMTHSKSLLFDKPFIRKTISSNIDMPQSQELARAASLTSIARTFSMDDDSL